MKKIYIKLDPNLGSLKSTFIDFCGSFAIRLSRCEENQTLQVINELRNKLLHGIPTPPTAKALDLAFAQSAVLDLLGVGWKMKAKKTEVYMTPPVQNGASPLEQKDTVRRGHLIERDSQLRQKSVRKFIKRMENRSLTDRGWHSIFSLMRDGRALASELHDITSIDDEEKQVQRLGQAIRPYLQLVNEKERCEHTGLLLNDIWRYFRHSWINAYKTMPGRSMTLLVRDAAASNHPIIGIAALGSSVVQQRIRDRWIGWDQETFIEEIAQKPTVKYAKWLLNALDRQINAIYSDDLYAEGICHSIDIDYPTDEIVRKLEKDGERAIERHRLFPHAASIKSSQAQQESDIDWEQQARTHLYRSKRCKTIAKLLRLRNIFQAFGLKKGTKSELEKALKNSNFRSAIGKLVRMVKAEHVGIDMMDIIICGAVAPYNSLLGGKLVSILLCSPEVVKMYSKRYDQKISIIASSMKGKTVIRRPQLVLLATTSLYGVGSSQYNRIRIPCQPIGGPQDEKIEYKNLGKSEGYGSYHFSDITLKIANTMLARAKEGRRVNSIFGEGVNPRMRKIREALGMVGLPPDDFLTHGNPRIIYTIRMAKNFREVLLGMAREPKYLFPLSYPKKTSERIATFWRKRWLRGRIAREGILEEVSQHTLSYPVTHGARVMMPRHNENGEKLVL